MKDFYGRRKTRPLKNPELLEALHKEPLSFQEDTLVNFEIGIGSGDFIAHMGENYPDEIFIGCDLYLNGLASAIKKTKDLSNVFLYMESGKVLLEKFPPFSKIFVLFPDPWPKKRHHKRRLLSVEFLKQLIAKAKDCLWLATDDEDYKNAIMENLDKIDGINVDISTTPPTFFCETSYAKKATKKNKDRFFISIYFQQQIQK